MKAKQDKTFKVIVNCPEIPGNTGSIGRTCLALDAELILIKPYGFDIDEKAVRRAGLDYWKYLTITEYDSFAEFVKEEKPHLDQVFLFTKNGNKTHFEAQFKKGCYLIFGQESTGLPSEILDLYPNNQYRLPMKGEHVRSLNLASAVTAVGYEALRQLEA